MNKTQVITVPIKPQRGWIYQMRNTLGLTLNKLAQACAVSTPTIAQAERGEVSGKITVETLRRAAEAMNCEFVYAFKPKSNFEEFINSRAYEKAKRILSNADLHMSLEDQRVSGELEQRIQNLKKKLIKEGKVW